MKKSIILTIAICLIMISAIGVKTTSAIVPAINVSRYSGADRYETAIKTAEMIKKQLNNDTFEGIIIASGTNFPDSLAGSYLACEKKAPILLVPSSISEEKAINVLLSVISFISENLKQNGTVYILGGEKAVPGIIEDKINLFRSDSEIVRIGGKNRYQTNIEILTKAGVGRDNKLIVCDGNSYADALSASACALAHGVCGLPLLL